MKKVNVLKVVSCTIIMFLLLNQMQAQTGLGKIRGKIIWTNPPCQIAPYSYTNNNGTTDFVPIGNLDIQLFEYIAPPINSTKPFTLGKAISATFSISPNVVQAQISNGTSYSLSFTSSAIPTTVTKAVLVVKAKPTVVPANATNQQVTFPGVIVTHTNATIVEVKPSCTK